MGDKKQEFESIAKKQISAYIEMTSIPAMFAQPVFQGNSKKTVEARRLLQIFYLGFMDGICQTCGLSEKELIKIQKLFLEENDILKDFKISDKEFPLEDWYTFAEKGIIDTIEGKVLYYGGLTARIHVATVNGSLDREYAESNAFNAINIPMDYNQATKKEFQVSLDEWIDTALKIDKQVLASEDVKNENELDNEDEESRKIIDEAIDEAIEFRYKLNEKRNNEIFHEISRRQRKKRDNSPGCLVPIIISLSSFGLLIISFLIG